MANEYIIKAGDTLSELAEQFNTTVSNLVKWNNITDPDFIVIGQKLSIDGSSTTGNTASLSSRAVVKVFGLQSDTERGMYATWTWDQSNTDHYMVRWWYYTKDNVWFVGNDSTTEFKQTTYTAPSNATKVKFYVKPISTKHTVNKKETSYWTADWSTEQIYDFSDNPPTTPSGLNVTIDKHQLTAVLENLNVNGTHVQFQVVKDDTTVVNTGKAAIQTGTARYTCTVSAGSRYKVRCRSVRDDKYSPWSDYTSNIDTIPAVPAGFTKCDAKSETSVYLEWAAVNTAKTYDIEYTTKIEYFDGSDQTSTVTGIETTHYEKTGLTSGEEYFFRVRAVNSANPGTSGWSAIKSIRIGKPPAAPTTWSSTTTVVTGEPLKLYWVHNAEDGSSQTYGDLELYINGVRETHTITNSTEEDEKDKTSVYSIDTSSYVEGSTILWRVRTAGVTRVYGDWSIQRTVDVYAPPTLAMTISDNNGELVDVLESLPLKISAVPGPDTQLALGYHLTITADEAYDTVDYAGNPMMISVGDSVYSKYFDTSADLDVTLSAGDVNLQNNVTYTCTCVVSMNSGLTAESESEFRVSWTDDAYEPNAEIGYDPETYTTSIRPYVVDTANQLIEGVTLSVYRREFDGRFTELATGIDNLSNTYITDPHPALDYARYRVVATTENTGSVSYYDVPGYYIGESAVIIQWSEAWSNFDVTTEEAIAAPTWSGSLLRLPYNIDTSENNAPDVRLIEYIGRQHPVGYYGTHLGTTTSWSVEIEKDDIETLYALRRLQIWMGDVYVREPSGTGYWATIKVSFSQTHLELTIPVNLDITRVEGGK